MKADPFSIFKKSQKTSWGAFSPLEIVTTIPAATLVKFSGVAAHQTVLDVGCGTGVVAITAARAGANVFGLDLSPVLIEHAQENTKLAKVNVNLQEGDVEAMPYPDNFFDVVLSQFGHMFAPRPNVAVQEMLRVLKPGGMIAFSTWPPEIFVGRLFLLVEKYSPLPQGISSPSLWGDPSFVRAQLGDKVDDLVFDQGLMHVPALSLGHYQHTIEPTLGPIVKLIQESQGDLTQLNNFRAELEELASQYYFENHIHQHYLMCRGKKG